MRTITPTQALEGKQYAIVARDSHVYDLYETKDEACRICQDLVARYGEDSYYAAAIDFGREHR